MADAPVQFGRYKLLNLLGEGGMAKVYRALLSGPMGFEKEVALKRLDAKVTADERVVRALINEARLGGQLRHKNIVEIYEFNQVEGNYFLAMEFVDGWTLESVLRRCRLVGRPMPASVIIEILTHVCRGLDYAHDLHSKEGVPLNLVHRDLKPGNIMISRAGDVKIMDFGIAKADTNLYKTTAADVTKGTPIYMSPEQVTGSKLDRRSDLFSLGSILHELVTLDVPFRADNLLAIMHAVLHADTTAAAERVKAAAPGLDRVLERCMARAPEERYATASEVDAALRALRRSLPPGPTLFEWIQDNLGELPASSMTGDFGPEDLPAPYGPEGTQSLAAMDSIPPGMDPTVDLASGDHEPAAPDPLPVRAPAVAETRLQAPVSSTSSRRPRRKRTRSSRMLPIAALLALGSVALLVGVWLRDRPEPGGEDSGTEGAPALDPDAAEEEPASAEPAAGPDAGEDLAAPSVGTAAAAATPRPRPAATPIPKATPTIEAPEPSPAIATGPTGRLRLGAKPWAYVVTSEGRRLGRTPLKNVELPAGEHRLTLECPRPGCDPPESRTVTVRIPAGGTYKDTVYFYESGN